MNEETCFVLFVVGEEEMLLLEEMNSASVEV